MNKKIILLQDVNYSYPLGGEEFSLEEDTVLEILDIVVENKLHVATTLTPHGHEIEFILKQREGEEWFEYLPEVSDGEKEAVLKRFKHVVYDMYELCHYHYQRSVVNEVEWGKWLEKMKGAIDFGDIDKLIYEIEKECMESGAE